MQDKPKKSIIRSFFGGLAKGAALGAIGGAVIGHQASKKMPSGPKVNTDPHRKAKK